MVHVTRYDHNHSASTIRRVTRPWRGNAGGTVTTPSTLYREVQPCYNTPTPNTLSAPMKNGKDVVIALFTIVTPTHPRISETHGGVVAILLYALAVTHIPPRALSVTTQKLFPLAFWVRSRASPHSFTLRKPMIGIYILTKFDTKRARQKAGFSFCECST